MAEILSIPAEFDTIQVVQKHLESGSHVPHVVKRDVPRPPLGWFTHHAVQTFAKQCSEGRIGLNWEHYVACARETWKSLSPEELFTLRQAADEDKQRYDERVELARRGGAEELVHLVEEKKLQESSFAPSAFDLFKNSPQVRARLLNARTMKGEESLTLDIDPRPPEESPSTGKEKRLCARTRRLEDDEEVLVSTDEAEGDDKQKSQVADAKVDPDCWKPTGDDDLTADEKELLESIPPNVCRWDRSPRAARNAYTLYYADRLTAEGSPHLGEDPHCPSTRAKIHAAWEAVDHDTRQHFENVAEIDKQEFDRQEKEWYEWLRAWPDSEHRLLLRKVIDRWHPHSSFGDGQNRPRADIPPCGREAAVPTVDYKLQCLYYPVIRTDYSNGAVYEHLRHVLLDNPIDWMQLTFYDGLQPPSFPVEDVRSYHYSEDDPRANDYEWCKTNFESKSLDDLKASFGELSFHEKEHIPVYRFGGDTWAIIIDAQSMKDGTVVFVCSDNYTLVDTRPDDDRAPDGAWEQDPKKEWHVAPRVQAADVIGQLVNVEIGNVGWEEYIKHEVDHGLDLLSDPKAQRWRGWQWAIEDVFGEGSLESVVGVVEREICYFPFEDEE